MPLNLSNFVFCQYTFWEHAEPTVAPPMVSPDTPSPRSPDTQFSVRFDHCQVRERAPPCRVEDWYCLTAVPEL